VALDLEFKEVQAAERQKKVACRRGRGPEPACRRSTIDGQQSTTHSANNYLKWSLLMNFLLQTGHSKFFSPVWVLVCLASSSDLANRLPQLVHEQGNGRSPATITNK
jgi:hypothetical protein